MGFLDYLDNIEDKIIKNEEKPTINDEKVVEEKNIVEDDPNVKTKIILELNKFGLSKSAIDNIVENVFNNSKEKSNFNKKCKKIDNKKVIKKENNIDHASLILDGLEQMSPPNINSSDDINVSNLNMENNIDHASAILM